jgi:hypothetical protein
MINLSGFLPLANVKRRAFRHEVRIYVESFYRCPEMIAIREALMQTTIHTNEH